MEFPYCVVDGVEYQLVFVNDVLRFPNTKEGCKDLNKLVISYYEDKVDLQVIWEEYTQTGSSYSLVEQLFSPYGMNNHTTTQGKGECKHMVLHSGDPEVDKQYNYSGSDKLYYDAENIIMELSENFNDYSNSKIINLLEDCKEKLKKYEEL